MMLTVIVVRIVSLIDWLVFQTSTIIVACLFNDGCLSVPMYVVYWKSVCPYIHDLLRYFLNVIFFIFLCMSVLVSFFIVYVCVQIFS